MDTSASLRLWMTCSGVCLFPGIFLTLTVMGVSLAGDGLRDILDPKLKRRL